MSKRGKQGWAIAGAIAGVVAVAGIIFALRGNEPPVTATPDGAGETPAKPPAGSIAPVQKPGNPQECDLALPTLTIAPCLPSEIPGGANNANLEQAAGFAWQEFIALSWPAVEQTGKPNTRGVADPFARLDAINGIDGALPTWMTFRHKVEIFPGDGNQPHGNGTPGEGLYDDLPKYIYNPKSVGTGYVENNGPLTAGQIPACAEDDTYSLPEGQTFVTADEVSQIGQDYMFAGKNEQQDFGSNQGDPASASQILFLVKANRTYFDYIVPSDSRPSPWWQGIPKDVRTRTTDYLATNHEDPPSGSRDKVSFPDGTIMVKSAWRRATDEDQKSQRYIIKPVRYYQHQESGKTYGGQPGNSKYFCHRTNLYALVGLHILQKTPTAPYFTYATFEHADNLLTADGQPLENGEDSSEPPLTPEITATNATATTPQSFEPKEANCSPGSSLYYENDAHLDSETQKSYSAVTKGRICVRGRLHDIPVEIDIVNDQVSALIGQYNDPSCSYDGSSCFSGADCCTGTCKPSTDTNNVLGTCVGGHPPAPSVLQYYKLINVQTKPVDKPAGQPYSEQGGVRPSTYYMANIVVETNYPLQVFSGTFNNVTMDGQPLIVDGQPLGDGTITDFVSGEPFKNIQYDGGQYNMGGCMGCHGVAQSRGGGFSFMFDGISDGFSGVPEVPRGPKNSPTNFSQRYDRFLGRR